MEFKPPLFKLGDKIFCTNNILNTFRGEVICFPRPSTYASERYINHPMINEDF